MKRIALPGRRMKRAMVPGMRSSACIGSPSPWRESCSASPSPRLAMKGNGCAGSIAKGVSTGNTSLMKRWASQA